MVTELVLVFRDPDAGPPLEFTYTLNSPEGFEVTGGQLFVENPQTSELERFSFRIDADEDGRSSLTILEDPNQ